VNDITNCQRQQDPLREQQNQPEQSIKKRTVRALSLRPAPTDLKLVKANRASPSVSSKNDTSTIMAPARITTR
jgi:hypothetical protein